MGDDPNPGIYLIIDIEWLIPFAAEQGVKAEALSDAVQGKSWIKGSVPAPARYLSWAILNLDLLFGELCSFRLLAQG